MSLSTFTRALLLIGIIAASGLTAGYWFSKSPPNPASTEQANEDQASEVTTGPDASNSSEPQEISQEQFASFAKPAAVVKPAARPAAASPPAVAPQVFLTEATPYTRQLVGSLTNLDFTHGPIAKEQADQWKQGLQTLVAQGPAALPAIREFLEQNLELNFTLMAGGNQLGQTSMRSALINALAQIGGPEATDIMLQTLQGTTLPSEIALLTDHLEQAAPGQYRQQAIGAINEVLGMANKGQLQGIDVGDCFKVLQKYGDAATTATMEQLQNQYRYYATLSLAGMPNGEGVPTLIRQAQDPAAGSKRDLSLQLLAQIAPQYPDAILALLDQARLNEIPDATWRKIATGLAGAQYQIGSPSSAAGQPAASLPGLKTYHIESGNQNFYSLPLSSADPHQLQQRLTLLDQLLATTTNPNALSALTEARATLSALVPK